eukprot:CAMPEP_0197029066 /NCGR_PEP_ID=MMETSP1384-20130603/8601_1 /TAXON_ID=29189 /ORGANISM="Ammonia sp." /LENGTH=306 /DNA_ID=CAMNT_0042458169 /DNA_START=22 /DNA_END=942 /DNA_ORIENTATION=+
MAESKQADTDSYQIPNALDSFDSIIANKTDNLLLFLDYDGTLSEIVANPDDAVLTKSMYELLIKLASYKHVTIIIVTGRSIEKVQSFIAKHSDIHFAGNHGIEIEFAQSKQQQAQKLFVDAESVKLLNEAYKELRDEYKVTEKYKGTQIEFKTYSLSLHYRNMAIDGDEQAAMDAMEKIMKDLSAKYKIHYSVGKKLFELKCVNDWNKGYAIKWMLDHRYEIFEKLKATQQDAEASNDVVFIGDDVTDEDGFDALLNYSKDDKINDNVSCVLVTHNHKPRPTKAGYHVNTVKDVEEFLRRISQKLN